jgi:hypothetical protein
VAQRPAAARRFLRHSLSRSRPLEQAKKQTDGPQTRANTRLRALNAQEDKAGNRANIGGTGKKNPTDKGWDFKLWWTWRDLNPRPQTFFEQFYMCSRLI